MFLYNVFMVGFIKVINRVYLIDIQKWVTYQEIGNISRNGN